MNNNFLSSSRKIMRCQRPRGFAIITVVAMIALAAACFVVLGEVFSYQLKLTDHTIARLQMDLLLHAGESCAINELADGKVLSDPWEVPLPAALVKNGGRLTISEHRQGENKIFFTVKATFADLHSRRVLEFQHDARHWRLTRVAIPGSSFDLSALSSLQIRIDWPQTPQLQGVAAKTGSIIFTLFS